MTRLRTSACISLAKVCSFLVDPCELTMLETLYPISANEVDYDRTTQFVRRLFQDEVHFLIVTPFSVHSLTHASS